jgi:hypothetical protein
VSARTITGALCIYLLLGLFFAYLFGLLVTVVALLVGHLGYRRGPRDQ